MKLPADLRTTGQCSSWIGRPGSLILQSRIAAISRCSPSLKKPPGSVFSGESDTIRDKTLKSLPEDVARATAVVSFATQNSNSDIYILGISHVSLESCRHVRTLISTIQPDTVVLELCKDRTQLLVPEDAPPTRHWNASRVDITIAGMPPSSDFLRGIWPSTEILLSMLHCSPGVIITMENIEDDILTLLSTGLFGSITPKTKAPSSLAAPTFFNRSDYSNPDCPIQIETAAPLGAIEFIVTPRRLPPTKSLQIEWTGIEDEICLQSLQELGAQVKSQVLSLLAHDIGRNHPAATLCALLFAIKQVREEACSCVISRIDGVESGDVIIYVSMTAEPTNASQTITGLECTVDSYGRGIGITPYKWRTPRSAINSLQKRQSRQNSMAEEKGPAIVQCEPIPSSGACFEDQPDKFINMLASRMTAKYAEFQNAAGKKVGIGSGAVWQTALQTAADAGNGVQRVVLGDRPASVTGYKLAQSINAALTPYIVASVISFTVAAAGMSFEAFAPTSGANISVLDFPYIWLVSGGLGTVFLAYVTAAIGIPFAEIYRLSQLSGSDIEEAVALKVPLSSLGTKPVLLSGEDALLKWPGAMSPILHERDEYMTKVLLGLVGGRPEPGAPTYLRRCRDADGGSIFRYAMPHGGPPEACPQGEGEGTFESWPAKRVVAIVGTAHVKGMLKALEGLGGPEEADISLVHLCRLSSPL